MAEFNLIDERWIPCIDRSGQRVERNLRETLLKAHDLREICDQSPLVTVAIHRLLLAILYRAYKGPSDMAAWRLLYEEGRFTPGGAIDAYLDRWHERFYLFDDEHPFMQVAGLDLNEYKADGAPKKDKSDGLMRLLREAPDKSGRILFDHRVGTERPDYEPGQIAKMILSAQSYSSTGVASAGSVGEQRITPTACQMAPCAKGLVLWLQGDSLFQTLLLNLVPRDHVSSDEPAWEDDAIVHTAIKSWGKQISFVGPVQRFAPLSRFIRAIDRRSVFFTNGLKTGTDSDDPMKAYSRSDDGEAYQAVKLQKDRAAWRDAHALFSQGSPVRKPPASLNHVARLVGSGVLEEAALPRANIVGLATDKGKEGKAVLWRHDRMPVPAALLSDVNLIDRLDELLRNAEQAARELSSRTWLIARYYRIPADRIPSKQEKEDITALAKGIDPLPAYWARLEERFYVLLENLPNDWDQAGEDRKQQTATEAWRKHVKEEARRALEESVLSLGTTARAVQAVARVRTDFDDGDLKQPQAKPSNGAGKSARGRKGAKKR